MCSRTALCRDGWLSLKPYGCRYSTIVAAVLDSSFLLKPMFGISLLALYHIRNHMLNITYVHNGILKDKAFRLASFGGKLNAVSLQRKMLWFRKVAKVHLDLMSARPFLSNIHLSVLSSLVCHVHCLRPEIANTHSEHSLTSLRNTTGVLE